MSDFFYPNRSRILFPICSNSRFTPERMSQRLSDDASVATMHDIHTTENYLILYSSSSYSCNAVALLRADQLVYLYL